MSRDNYGRKGYYNRENRDREWSRNDYRYEKHRLSRKRSRTPPRDEKRSTRTPRKNEKEIIDDNILSEISKLPEASELWDSHLQDGFSAPQQQSFQQEGNAYVGNYQPSYSALYDDFPSVGGVPTAPQPPEISSWNQMSLPPPPAPTFNVEEQIKKEAAIESEMRHQKIALSKQREDYIKKAAILKKELDTLKDQRNELRGDNKRSPSPDTKRFLKENTKLQLEIQNKLKTINNVVDMLNGIIGEEAELDTDTPTQERERDRERGAKRKSRSPSNKKFNYVYYDPEMHWCRVCNEFPPTAKDYLNHLHSPAHHKMAAAHMEAPWHSVTGANEGFPSYPSAPTKRTPIRGLQFFVPSSAWYCKLCDVFIGDLHCASAHLKCVQHSKNYTNFVEQNPHWETDWMSDRQKALEKARAGSKIKMEDKPAYTAHTITFNKDGFHTKRKTDSPDKKKKNKKNKKNKNKKKKSSSSSDSSSSEDSEHTKKKSKKSKNKFEEAKLTEWMSSIQMDRLNDNDRKLLDNIKNRIKMDKEDRREKRDQREPVRQYRDERRESRSRDERDRRDDRRRDERRDERHERRDDGREERHERRDDGREERHERRDDGREERHERRDDGREERTDAKKTDIRKMMPFIGKMPVYKNLTKTSKTEEPKKEEKKKEEDEATKKRRVEMDAEIQKKVAEFKEKIAKAQLERQQAEQMPTLLGAMPGTLAGAMNPAMAHAFLPPPPAPAAPAHLPKDFQDALDIIFPSEVKGDGQADMYQAVPGLAPPGAFPGLMGGMMAPFQQLGLLAQPPVVMGFDVNAGLFQQQVYDAHVNNTNTTNNTNNTQPQTGEVMEKKDPTSRNKEELDELALLGIDASDVGAGI